MTLLKVMGLFILWPLFPLWLIWLFWKQQEQKKEERESAQLTREIARLEGIKNGPPSQLEGWIKEQRRAAEEKRRAAEERRRAEEKRKAEEKRRRAEKAARKRIPPEREVKGLEGSLQQWFMRQSSSLKIAILLGSALLLLCLCTGLATMFSPTPKPTPTTVPPTVPGKERVWEEDGSVMVHVPAGEFLMGSKDDPAADDDEHPQHTIYVSEFWIDKTEVTNAQYRKCVEAGACRATTTCDYGDPTYSDSSKADHPVVCVPWQGATAYCEWAGKRLPTEAEWEKAARGTDGRRYPWGNSFDSSRVNFCDVNCEFDDKDSGADDGYRRIAPVGSYPQGASPYGALDMAGNVYEWCQDWYDGDYYASSPQRDPQGPSSGEYRVHRGASWGYYEAYMRAPNRGGSDPGLRNDIIGFRCVSQSPPTTMLTPTPRPPTSTPSGLPTAVLSESVRKQVFRDWVDAKNSGMGDEEARAEIARGWGITVDYVKAIIAEGIQKSWMPTATATPIPVPPTPTPILAAKPAFEVRKVLHTWLKYDWTFTHTAVEIRNKGNRTARLGHIAFTVYDVNGEVLDAIPAQHTVPRIIRPGEVVYAFAERLHEDLKPGRVGELKVNFDYDFTSEEPQLLTVENLSGGEGDLGYEVTGEVVNTSGESAGEIRVAVALYDKGNNLLGVLWAYPQVTLAPGDRMGFVAFSGFSFPPEVGKQVKRLVGVAHNLKR